ncbi:MAG: isoprenyl transferase [Clostridia bacterium]|nr:isoprenyl transferase [Clostridia bacterium]
MFKKSISVDFERLPKHIGIIMDGNGRWAKKRKLPRTAGHTVGAKTFKSIARYCNKIGIEYLTVYAFSTENWKRPKDEVDAIMKLLKDYLVDAKNFKDENIKVKFIGDLSPLSDDLKQLIKESEEGSADATGLNLNIALNYGGRDEIVYAAKKIAKKVKEGIISPDEIDEKMISGNIYTASQPNPDIIIRPSGEYRISNFLIWQSAYSEFWYSDVLWPDFKPKDLDRAIIDFQQRNRRFGGI